MTKIPHYYSQEEAGWLPLTPKATTEDFGRVKLVDQIGEIPEDSNSSVAVTPKAISEANTSLKNTLTTAYVEADVNLKKNLEAAYKKADEDLKTEITNAYKAADGALETKITSAYEAADEALKTEITGAYKAADTNIETAYKKADEDLKTEITNGTVVAKKAGTASKLEGKNIEGPVILNFKDGKPVSYTDDTNIGSSSQPIYFDAETGKFKVCDTSLHSTNIPTKTDRNQTLSGDNSVSIVSSIDWNGSGHIGKLTCGNLSLGAAGANLGGIKTGGDLSLADGVGSVTHLNLSDVKVNNSTTQSLQTVFDTALKKSGDTFTGNLIGDQSNIIFTGDNNGLLWRLNGVDYDLLKTDGSDSSGHIYTLGSTSFDTHIEGTSLHLQPSSGYLYINGAQGNNILQNVDGITLGNNQSILHLLSSDRGIHTNYPVQMHAARYHLHEGLGSGTASHNNGVPITYTNASNTAQNRQGACLPLQLFSATSSFMGATDGNSKLFDRVYYWGDGSDSNSTGYDLAENALIAKYNASLLISGTIYANQLEAGSSIGGQLVYSTNKGESFEVIAGRQEVRLLATATSGYVILPPTIVKVAKNSRLGLRCYTYTKSGYVPTHSSDGVNVTGRTHLDIVCLGLNDDSVQMEPLA